MERFSIYYDNYCVAIYKRDDKEKEYSYYGGYPSVHEGEIPNQYLTVYKEKTPFRPIEELMNEENRVAGTRKLIYQHEHIKIVRVPRDIEHFVVYNMSARKGSRGYSEEKFDAPHYEGKKTPEGMREWASFYEFIKKDDGTYEAALEENWWWGGGHNDGGIIHAEIPEEYLALPYDEFLEQLLTVAKAGHYGFTTEYLKNCEGLKEFFGGEPLLQSDDLCHHFQKDTDLLLRNKSHSGRSVF